MPKRVRCHRLVRVVLVTGAALSASCAPSTGPPPQPADLVLLNGKIITVDADDRIAQGVAVRDGRIVAVGTDTEIDRFVGPDTRRVDLEGRTATPGLLDAHAHFSGGGVDRLFNMDLSYPSVTSVADVVALVREQAVSLEPGEWIRGVGWDEGKFEELRYIHAADLDSVAPDNPVWLEHTMGHYGAANSLALELAGITAQTPDPFGGTIDRAPDGSPTGVMKESAQGMVRGLMPGFTRQQRKEGIAALAAAFNREGMTGLKDPGISQNTWEIYREVLEEGGLSVRVFALWSGGRSVERTAQIIDRVAATTRPYESTGDDRLISGGVKLFADGSGGARTAWLYDEWNMESIAVDSGNYGYPTTEPEVLREQITMLHDAGLHTSVHAIGDRTIDWVIDSYWEALQANPTVGLRHGIIHMNIPTDHALDRVAEMQSRFDAAYPEPSATFTWWIGDTYAGNFGPERALRLNPFRTYQERGIRWANGSDFSVTPFPARYGLWSAVARETTLGVYGSNPWGMDESVDVRTALRAVTIWPAHQMFLEDAIGSIEVGKYADIAVWNLDPYSVETAALRDMQCVMTLFNGEVVWEGS